jgi:hypothetical protein
MAWDLLARLEPAVVIAVDCGKAGLAPAEAEAVCVSHQRGEHPTVIGTSHQCHLDDPTVGLLVYQLVGDEQPGSVGRAARSVIGNESDSFGRHDPECREVVGA